MGILFRTATVKGNGMEATEERTLPLFHTLNTAIGNAAVTLVQGDACTIRIDADQNLIKHIRASVKEGELRLGVAGNTDLRPTLPIRIHLTLPGLSSLVNSGSARIDTGSILEGTAYTVQNSGSGLVNLALRAVSVRLLSSGSGGVVFSGSCTELSCTVSGSGSVDASQLRAEKIYVHVSGSGHCKVACTEKLAGKISGSGGIRYWGHPPIVQVAQSGAGVCVPGEGF